MKKQFQIWKDIKPFSLENLWADGGGIEYKGTLRGRTHCIRQPTTKKNQTRPNLFFFKIRYLLIYIHTLL